LKTVHERSRNYYVYIGLMYECYFQSTQSVITSTKEVIRSGQFVCQSISLCAGLL